MRPRLGVLAYAPIQYHTPLFQRLASRGNVDLDVLFLSDRGYQPMADPQFGVTISWDIDLLSGYPHRFLSTSAHTASAARRLALLSQWVAGQHAVAVNGYTSPWMLAAMAICRARGIPYLLRASAHPRGLSGGMRRHLRWIGTRLVVSASAGGLCMGQLNAEFYRQHRARRIIFTPNSVDDARFAAPPPLGRRELLARWGLEPGRPVIMFCGKLYPGKRPLDLVAALGLLRREVTVLFVGDGVLAGRVRAGLRPGAGVVTGFVNQSELPAYSHAADVLVVPSEAETWGLVINEAMAAGTLPVVSDGVGAAPDLVRGVGEIYPCGDVPALAAALERALARTGDPAVRRLARQHAARYSLDRTAEGYEEAALAVSGQRRRR